MSHQSFYSTLCRLLTLVIFFSYTIPGFTQDRDSIPNNWHLLDFGDDGVYGISMEKAYRELLVNRNPDTIVVAVIDTGIDTLHEDLKPVLWHNPCDLGNDEDGNGYLGDRYGWNFLGGKDGSKIYRESQEFIRQYFRLANTYRNKKPGDIKRKQWWEYQIWVQVKEKFQSDSAKAFAGYQNIDDKLKEGDRRLRAALGQEEYTASDLTALEEPMNGNRMFGTIMRDARNNKNVSNINVLTNSQNRIEKLRNESRFSHNSPLISQRQEIIGDDYYDLKDRYYGNGDIRDFDPGKHGVNAQHGTPVAGLIGAVRNNGIGINGIADAVKIMAIRALVHGDEYDKDIALAIRYAVDNGARVINMSFAKRYSPQQKWVEQAIRYAARKDVLLVNAAGNDGSDNDKTPIYPSSKYMNKDKRFPNMITVGASGPTEGNLVAAFSNYGNEMVDVFAPGINIYSTMNGYYSRVKGTSFASPIVAGLAAVLRSYYPQLTAQEVKHIIEASVTKIDKLVIKPGQRRSDGYDKMKVLMEGLCRMKDLCRTGGIINAYRAIQQAESITNGTQ